MVLKTDSLLECYADSTMESSMLYKILGVSALYDFTLSEVTFSNSVSQRVVATKKPGLGVRSVAVF